MKVLVDIPDNEATFGMKVLKSLSFITEAKPMTRSTVELWNELKESAEEVRFHKRGKIKLKTAVPAGFSDFRLLDQKPLAENPDA